MGIHWDQHCRGLGIREFKTKNSYVYREKGSSNTITIGDVSIMTLAQARKQAVSLGGKMSIEAETFADLALEWGENWGQFQRKRYKTEDLRRLNKYILPAIGDKRAKEIKTGDLLVLKDRISLKGKIEANRCIALIGAIFSKAIEWELFDGQNPVRLIKRHPECGRSRVADSDEITRLIAVLKDHPLGTLFMLCLMCGLRRSEAASIKWSDVDFSTNSLILRATKNGQDRVIYFGDELKSRLEKEKSLSAWVFPSSITGSHIKHIRRPWRQIKYEAQIEGLTIHDLRRTFATKLIENGVPIEHVSKALGHSSIAITQNYVHVSNKITAQVFEKASKIFK